MAVGGVTALAGIINMNVEDPCDDVADSPFTECISNADGVRTVGVIGTGVGASLAVVGALRYLQGVNRAQTYREWRRAPEHSEQETPSNEITDSASGSRGGFLIGFGAGPGLTSFQLSGDAFGERVSLERTSKASLMTDFKIGYAPSDLLAVYWMSKVAWGRFGNGDDPPLITNGFGGLGASYRIQRDGDPLFLNGGLGFSTWASPTDPDTDAMFGPGFVIGSELEFAKNWVVDADLMWGRPSRDAFRYSTLGLKLTVNYLHY